MAVAVATEAALRTLATLTRTAAPPEDQCGGGKHRHTTAIARMGERRAAMPAAAGTELFRGQLAEGPRKVPDRDFR